ncbi:MAG: EFR1 family ferrodoxin [Eubacterium sp.]|nr:EFR1 family ferrodoxin [Eubacterium sp.]
MLGIYLSGTGNTKHCIEKLIFDIDPHAEILPIEDKGVLDAIKGNDTIFIAYPTQFSNVPYMVRDFIQKNSSLWKNKSVLCMTTMGAFSGDGAGCAARLLKKYGAHILGGIQTKMPDSVCDSKLLKKTFSENMEIIKEADKRIEKIAEEIKSGKYPQEGISFFSHLCGLFGQRLWFYGKTAGYTDKLKIHNNCVGCGKCAKVCPMKNIHIVEGKAVASNKCTMCYRCVSLCPQQAATLLGGSVVEQCRFEKYNGKHSS